MRLMFDSLFFMLKALAMFDDFCEYIEMFVLLPVFTRPPPLTRVSGGGGNTGDSGISVTCMSASTVNSSAGHPPAFFQAFLPSRRVRQKNSSMKPPNNVANNPYA